MKCDSKILSSNNCNYRPNENIPVDTLLNTLRREETLRLCPELQKLYDSCGARSPPGEIESEIQRISLLENGYCRCWLDEYWNTSVLYPFNSSEIANTIRNTTVWLRHFERFIDVMQAAAFVFNDISLYLLEFKKVISFLPALFRDSKP